MKKITVSLAARSYAIYISQSGKELASLLGPLNLPAQALIMTNRRVRAIAGSWVTRSLRQAGIAARWLMIPDSEASKSFRIYEKSIQHIATHHGSQQFFLVALGGGVIGDLCGFVAATYRRGIPYIQIPTTLLAQVDSAIGGKTAIDLAEGKNLVGAFYQPRLVFSFLNVLSRLPQRQLRSGCAELIKYGVIADPTLFAYLESAACRILGADPAALERVISAASAIKARIVSLDEREDSGLRTILNFGHTVGHALEAAGSYRRLTHGEAISIGMLSATDIASDLGLCDRAFCERLEGLIKAFGLPVRSPQISLARVMRALRRDKKFVRGRMRFVLPVQAGHVIVTESIPQQRISSFIQKRVGAS